MAAMSYRRKLRNKGKIECKLAVLMPMVRRLIRYFLNWLRQILTQLKKEKTRRHISSPVKQLPPKLQQPHPAHPQRQLLPPLHTAPKQPISVSDDHQALFKQKSPQLIPNPAARRAKNSSKFEVQLSDYHYSPSSAIQNLNNQLTNPAADNFMEKETLQSSSPMDQSVVADNRFIREMSAQLTTSETKRRHQPRSDDRQNLPNALPEVTETHKGDTNAVQVSPVQPLSFQSVEQPTVQRSSRPVNHSHHANQTDVHPDPGVIIKKGVVKLLFKLKKNNHHGYIAPDDGSKDIIFHQKYIGRDVFNHLERGAAVEVTAHITEGKAYADHVRIL